MPEDPELCKLLARSSKMENAQLNKCGLCKNDADLLILAFDPTSTPKNFSSSYKLIREIFRQQNPGAKSIQQPTYERGMQGD